MTGEVVVPLYIMHLAVITDRQEVWWGIYRQHPLHGWQQESRGECRAQWIVEMQHMRLASFGFFQSPRFGVTAGRARW